MWLSLAGALAGLALGAVAVAALSFDRSDRTEDDRSPETTLIVRLTAPEDGCWIATIEDEIEEGCGSRVVVLDARDEVDLVFERDPPAAWTWCLNLEVDGKVVQTFGPDSNPEYSLGSRYVLPEQGYGENFVVEPVSC